MKNKPAKTVVNDFVSTRVQRNYRDKDLNCASTSLLIMAEYFAIELDQQVLDAAVGMHGAGGYRAQCGLVEGTLMFIGIIGRSRSLDESEVISFCRRFAELFEKRFTSLQCKMLRPGGFQSDDPPHLCEGLTVDSIEFSIALIDSWLGQKTSQAADSV
jgi:hypothetical protein